MGSIDNFSKSKILIVGDIMLDHYIYGNVSRMSPEAPVPVLDRTGEKYYLGGSGNVLSNIISMSGNSDIISIIGNDRYGKIVSGLINEISPNSFIYSDSSRKTTLKSRYIHGSRQLLRVDEESKHYIDHNTERLLADHFDSVVTNYSCVIIEDYNKGLLTPRFISHIIEKCNSEKIDVIVDPKTMNIDSYANCNLIKPNLSEFCKITGYDATEFNLDTLKSYARNFIDKYSIDSVLVTLSEKGLFYITKDLDIYDPGYPVNVSDVSGAGDTVISILSLCISSGIDFKHSLSLCNIAASIACSRSGIVSVTVDDIKNSKFYCP